MIKKDCLMYVEEIENCNALTKMECEGCSFYKKATKQKQEEYKNQFYVKKRRSEKNEYLRENTIS